MLFRKLLGAAARAQNYTDLALLLQRHCCWVEAGIIQSLGRRGNRQRHNARHVLTLARVDPPRLIEFRDLSRDVYRQIGWIEARNSFDARFANKQRAAKGLFTNAVRTDYAQTGDDDAWNHRLFAVL